MSGSYANSLDLGNCARALSGTKQAGCSYRVGFVQSELGLQVRCPAKKGIEVIFDYFGQRFIKLFCRLAKFPKGQRITIHLKARLVGYGRIPIVESKAAHGPAKCLTLVHIPEPKTQTHKHSLDQTIPNKQRRSQSLVRPNYSGAVTLGTGPAWNTTTPGSSARGTGAGTTELQRQNGLWANKNVITLRNGATTYSTSPPINGCISARFTLTTRRSGQLSCVVGSE